MSGILIKLELFILDFQNVVPISKEMSTQSLKEHGWLKGFSMQKRGLFSVFQKDSIHMKGCTDLSPICLVHECQTACLQTVSHRNAYLRFLLFSEQENMLECLILKVSRSIYIRVSFLSSDQKSNHESITPADCILQV